MIKVQNLNKYFGNLHVLKDISIEFDTGKIITIVGASGAGKTTFLQVIGTIEKPSSGKVFYDDLDVFSLNDRTLSSFRNKNIGFVFQFHHLLPEFSALENVILPALIAGEKYKNAVEKANKLFNFLNISHRSHHKPTQLSGGEAQRVAVARALINNPKYILADEPSGNLDSKNAEDLHNLFLKLNQEFGQSFIIITHNRELANIAHIKLEMKDGKFINQ